MSDDNESRSIINHMDQTHYEINQLEAELATERKRREKLQNVHKQYRESLRGIASMDPATEGERMKQWAMDSLSGFIEPVEATLKNAQDALMEAYKRAERAEAELAALQKRFE